MIEDNLPVESYLQKIYQQNEKIIGLLERCVSRFDIEDIDSANKELQQINLEKLNNLSPREHQIIELIVEGKLNKEIAYAFSISLSTVESHRSNIMRKLGATNVAQLIKIYLQCKESV